MPVAIKGGKKGGAVKRRSSSVSQSSTPIPPHSTTLPSSSLVSPIPSPLLSAHTATSTTTSLPGTTPVVKVDFY